MHTTTKSNSIKDSSKNKGNKSKDEGEMKAPVKAPAAPKNVFSAFGGDSDSDDED